MSDLQTYTIVAAVVVAAAAISLQTVLLFALYRSSRAQREQLTQLAAKLEPLAEQSQHVLADVRKQVGEVTARVNEVVELGRKQLARAWGNTYVGLQYIAIPEFADAGTKMTQWLADYVVDKISLDEAIKKTNDLFNQVAIDGGYRK